MTGVPRSATIRVMDTLKDSDGFLGIAELAELLDVSAYTVRRWHLNGTGPPSFRVGKQVRFRRSEVEAWLEALREDAL